MSALKRNRHEPFLLRWKKECGKSDVAHSDKYTIERFIHARPYIRQEKKSSLFSEAFFDRFDHCIQGTNTGETFTVPLDNSPGGIGGMGPEKHIIGRFFIRLPFFPVSPVFLAQFPSLAGVQFTALNRFNCSS